jgi:hypothetical protein
MWRVPCKACGHTFCMFEGERPAMSDTVDVDAIRNLAGQPIYEPLIIQCLTCEADFEDISMPPEWEPV